VNGANAHKYAHYKLATGQALSSTFRTVAPSPPPPLPPPVIEPPTKDMGTQSDYRESEAQTLPWTPDLVDVQPGSDRAEKQAGINRNNYADRPELLDLADLTFGAGLPAGV
jgi:hypothetical protein